MNFIELLAFIIAMLAFFILVLKQAREERRRRRHPELYEQEIEEQQEQVKHILESLNFKVDREEVEERSVRPTPPPIPMEVAKDEVRAPSISRTFLPNSPFKAAVGNKDGVFVDPYARRKKEIDASFDAEVFQQLGRQRIRVKEIIEEASSLKHAVILKEILGPPKGL